jgi:S-DNA-T family DNA segregation ATPase FtsK/SpoIIIE
MTNNKELFKQAIAEAKIIRETTLAEAKLALEETFQPRVQSMLQAKLQEMADTTDEEKMPMENIDSLSEDESIEEEFNLDELLAELQLDEEENSSEEIYEAKDSEDEDEEEGEDEKEESVADLSVEELKDIIRDIISAEMGENESEVEDMSGEDESMEDEMPSEDEMMGDDEVDLEELLAELDVLGEADDTDKMEEAKKKPSKEEKEEKDKEMKEALDTIEILRNELNEVNLLNAKLLYVNKIFKAKNLTESQKVKVLEAFDEADNVKEVKLVFESLNTTLTSVSSVKKTSIKENLGFASKSAGVAPKKQIVEVDNAVNRMQLLAGIKK